MTIAKRLGSGFAVLLFLSAALAAYEAYAVRKMQSVVRRNSGENLDAALAALELTHDRAELENAVRRHFAARSADSLSGLTGATESFESSLNRLQSLARGDKARAELARLALFWKEYQAEANPALQNAPSQDGAEPPPGLLEQIERLKAQSTTVYQAALRTVTADAEASRRDGDKTFFVMLIFATAGLVGGSFLAILIHRSITVPLGILADGTRAVAEGKSFYRLDSSGNDELAQIAKDFNSIIRQSGRGIEK